MFTDSVVVILAAVVAHQLSHSSSRFGAFLAGPCDRGATLYPVVSILPSAPAKLTSSILSAVLAAGRGYQPHAVYQPPPIRDGRSAEGAFKRDAEFSNDGICDLQTFLTWLSAGRLRQRKQIRFGPMVRQPSQTPTLAVSVSDRLSERYSSIRRQRPAVGPRLGHSSRSAVTWVFDSRKSN